MSTHASAIPSLFRTQQIRRANERPAIPWHQHGVWTEWALRHTDEPARMPPHPLTAQDVLDLIRGIDR